MYGSHQETIWNAVKMQSGYMQLMAPPYLENPSLENAMDVHPQDWEKMKIKGITEISPRLVSYALIAHQSHSAVGRIFAANPEKEKHITVIHKRVKSGRWIQSSDECAIGSALARKLKVKLGDTISVITSQFDGSLGAANLNVVGIFQSDDYEIDRYFVYVTLEKGKELFRPNEGSSDHSLERYTSIAFGIDKSYRVETIFNQLATNFPLPNTNLEEYYLPVAFFWPDLIPSVVQLMTLDQVSGEITLSFLILIMAFGILNT
ncbi:MAG: ABC transporter permease, partial [Candidatus Hydrogenedentota bacterium]